MGYRFCHRCGWLSSDEYTYNKNEEPICPVHNLPATGFRLNEPFGYEEGYKR